MKFIQNYFTIVVFAFIIMLVQPFNSQAQSKGRNAGLDQTTFEIIKTRTSILEEFKKQNFNRVKIQCDSLRKAFENDNHLPFFPAEYWLLCFWTKDYASIIADKFLSDTAQYNNTYVSYPVFDNLGEEVRKDTRAKCEAIKAQITGSSFSQKDKDFLQIVLNYSIHKSNELKDTLQVSLNELSKKYMENYPNSINNGMLKGYIIKEYVGLKGADEVLFGGGYSVPSGKLGNYLSDGYKIEIIDYRKYFGSTFIGLIGNIYSGKLIDSLDIESKSAIVNVKTDEIYNVYNVGLDFGNGFYDTKRISLSAFGGGSFNALSVTHITNEKTNEGEQVTIYTYAARVGLAFDFKFVKQGVYASFKNYSDFNHSKFFRLKYYYEFPMYSDKASVLKGGIHNVTLSIGFNTRNIVKK